MRVGNLLLPFFPDTKALNKKWWHRLFKVLATMWSVVVGISILGTIIYLGKTIYQYQNTPTLLEITDNNTGKHRVLTYEELGNIAKEKYPEYNDLSDYELGQKIYEKKQNDPQVLIKIFEDSSYYMPKSAVPIYRKTREDIRGEMQAGLIALASLVALYFVPAITYRVILYVAVGDWNIPLKKETK